MNFEKFKEINDTRMNYREMEDATVVSNYRNVGCGDGYRIYLKIDENERITDASYTTTGCGFGIAALAMATEVAKNKTVSEAESLSESDIEKLFEFPERRKNYPESAIAALRQALKDYRTGAGIPKEKRITKSKALELLKENGNLSSVNLSSIILEKEKLDGVDFSKSDLHNAYLQNGSFIGANFAGANLRGAFLNNCNLQNADFTGADLRWAKLAGANIEGAIFTDAIYDIGTRIDSNQIHIFKVMQKAGKDIYMKAEEVSQ
ncbi:MAG TPA: pentapeptide repeat-containing protein [Leptospiraceae bacterium]|nr:pentapeptide repeat-containing protein [Leptospiraceae bacterium]HMW04044.1 pentapeptide repeat-containing protein [Leptospiraceae bacterium]HMX30934.1 pentapeptide repeat-containing protein [Leptospiraceae bacterium]HMY30038.1 pentapeptide repeat-containing protein [Leptospiraceae bacterium]HMZ62775.1 pentapeptide repeat-containing protein [Leptospiraceae bacterium]